MAAHCTPGDLKHKVLALPLLFPFFLFPPCLPLPSLFSPPLPPHTPVATISSTLSPSASFLMFSRHIPITLPLVSTLSTPPPFLSNHGLCGHVTLSFRIRLYFLKGNLVTSLFPSSPPSPFSFDTATQSGCSIKAGEHQLLEM